MNKDKLKTYTLGLFLVIILFFALFASNIFNRINLSILLVVFTVITTLLLKKRKLLSLYDKQVIIVMFIFAIIYLGLFYIMGIYFGFTVSSVKLSLWSMWNYIVPLAVIVITSEIIRNVFLVQKAKYVKPIVFISMVLIDMIIYAGIYDVTSLNGFLTVVGFILFASISCNLLYNYISIRFGNKSIIVYRLITILYIYFIPITPNVYLFFRSLFRMVYPYIIYLLLESTYSKSNFATAYKDKRKSIISISIIVAVMTFIIMLISCQFKYGVLVIGSGSMTGTIDKGDVVFFESYENQQIELGQVIIFLSGKTKVIHRVIDIKNVNGQIRYFTKGDANDKMDEGYVTKDNIFGVSLFKIKYIGYPTIWVKDIFS